ncbi:MAG: hypothetical protein ABL963_13865 [Longimicrobiales bacterium]
MAIEEEVVASGRVSALKALALELLERGLVQFARRREERPEA